MSRESNKKSFDKYEDEINKLLSSIESELADDANEELVSFSITMFIRNIVNEIISTHKDQVIKNYEEHISKERKAIKETCRKIRDDQRDRMERRKKRRNYLRDL
jgi:ElaB/YqjD/DUF883 family membrane-anchored ribosome-binding protein